MVLAKTPQAEGISPEGFEKLIHTFESGVMILDCQLNILYWNGWLQTYTKIEAKNALGVTLDQLFPSVNRPQLKRQFKAVLGLNSPMFFDNLVDNSFIPIRLERVINPVFETMQQSVTFLPFDQQKKQVAVVILDQTSYKEMQHSLSSQIIEKELQCHNDLELIDTQVLMLAFDMSGAVKRCTSAMAAVLQSNHDELLRMNLKSFFDRFATDIPDSSEDIWNTLRKGREWKGEFPLQLASGSSASLRATLNTHTANREIVALFEDITNSTRIKLLTSQDPLTQISNKNSFSKRLEHELGVADRYGSGFSLAMVNLDQFKALNDEHGHQAGDQVLVEVTEVIKQLIRDSDGFGRWSGEEFVLLFPQIDLAATQITLNKIRESLSTHRFAVVGQITASCGATAFRKGDTLNDIFERAEQALYRSKHSGGDRLTLF